MKHVPPCVLLTCALLLLASPAAWSTTAVDESLVHAARKGREAAQATASEARAQPDVAASEEAQPVYGWALAAPDALEGALSPLAAPPPPALPSALAETDFSSESVLEEAPLPGQGSGAASELFPAGLRSELGLPAPLDVPPR